MSDTLKLTAHQASDVEAASEKIYSDAADYVLDSRTLDRDMLALATIFLIAVTYHIQNPLMQFNTQFGSAFRNATLQPVMAVGLAIAVFALIGGRRAFQAPELTNGNGVLGNRTPIAGSPIRIGAAAILILYTVYMLLAVVFGFNLSGALFGIDQAVFIARLNDETPVTALESALALTTIFEYLAIISAIILLWRRVCREQQEKSREKRVDFSPLNTRTQRRKQKQLDRTFKAYPETSTKCTCSSLAPLRCRVTFLTFFSLYFSAFLS